MGDHAIYETLLRRSPYKNRKSRPKRRCVQVHRSCKTDVEESQSRQSDAAATVPRTDRIREVSDGRSPVVRSLQAAGRI